MLQARAEELRDRSGEEDAHPRGSGEHRRRLFHRRDRRMARVRKLYGRKFFRRAMDQEAQYRRETRDGIVWEHLPDQRLCRVKIQGSKEQVVAWCPENWEKTPVYLKPGNAVRIAHVGGIRNRIEIVSHGLTIPSPVAGGILPDMGAGANYWVSGGGLLATGFDSLRVQILPGVARLGGGG